jgi:arylsulfatase A-like enzyme
MYEESLRVPLLVRWPARIKPGSVDDHMVLNLDFPETFLAAAGLPVPPDMQGRSLLPLLEGHAPADWRTSMYYRYYDFPSAHHGHKNLGVRNERYKLIFYPELDEWELFDLKEDPKELKSVYDDPAYESVVAEMKAELKRLKELYRDDDTITGRRWKGDVKQEKAAAAAARAKASRVRLDAPIE